MHVLVLGVSAYPGDDDVVFVAEHEMHAPVAVEASLADVVVGAGLGSHTDAARLAATLAKLVDHTIEFLLCFAAKRLDARLTAPSDADAESRCHSDGGSRVDLRSEVYCLAGESVLQAFLRSRLGERALIGSFAQQLSEATLVLGDGTELC